MSRRNRVIAGIIFLGLFFLSLSYFFSRNNTQNDYLALKVATVVRETGEVDLIRSGLVQRIKVEKREDLGNFDSLETFEIGEATLIFESGFRLRVFGNSLLTLERVNDPENYHVLLILKRGDVRVDKNGREGELFISKNGQRVPAQAYNDSELKRLPVKEESEAAPAASEEKTLSEEEISTTMNNHKNSFFRCYTRLLQQEPQAKGEVTLTFTIENSGHPKNLDVAPNMILANTKTKPQANEDFKKCLRDVINRVEFRPFVGPQISTVFPLRFD